MCAGGLSSVAVPQEHEVEHIHVGLQDRLQPRAVEEMSRIRAAAQAELLNQTSYLVAVAVTHAVRIAAGDVGV